MENKKTTTHNKINLYVGEGCQYSIKKIILANTQLIKVCSMQIKKKPSYQNLLFHGIN